MPNKTPNLGLNTWLENDIVDFNEVNENFEILDRIPVGTESGTKTAGYTYGTVPTATWRYKKYADDTVEMSAVLTYNGLRCNQGTSFPYYSSESQVSFPFQFASVYDVQMHESSAKNSWIINTTETTIPVTLSTGGSGLKFKFVSTELENSTTTLINRQVFISVKGVLATT